MASRKGCDAVLIVAGLPFSHEEIIGLRGCTFMRRAAHEKIGLLSREEARDVFASDLGATEGTALAAGETDACLVTHYTRLPSPFEYLPVMRDRAVAAFPADHPLASRETVELGMLSDVSFLGYARERAVVAGKAAAHRGQPLAQALELTETGPPCD